MELLTPGLRCLAVALTGSALLLAGAWPGKALAADELEKAIAAAA